MIRHFTTLALILGLFMAPAYAITPEEQLADPILEDRARNISQQLRCLVCQNQSIDDSDADLARDLRVEVRSLITQGFDDDDIMARIRATYGDYVLLNPPVTGATSLLWAMPIILLVLGGLGVLARMRKSNALAAPSPQSTSQDTSSIIPATADDPAQHQPNLSPAIMASGLVILLLMTAGLYAILGRPDLSAQPLAARTAEQANAAQEASAQNAAERAALNEARRLANEDANSVTAQLRLAMAAAEAGAFDEELAALDQALSLTEDSPAITAMKAEALSRKAGGLVTIPARNLIAEVLVQSPDDPRANYLDGLAAYQDEDYATALERWSRLQSILPPTSTLAPRLAANIADAAARAGLTVPDNPFAAFSMADDMTEDERAAMINDMVSGLETRLLADGNDPAGWDRLINARQVLDDTDGMIRALIGAADAFPDDLERQVVALEAIVLEQQEGAYVTQALTLLERLNTITPRGPQFLFFAGHFAVISGEIQLAAALWGELASSMDDDNPMKAQLTAQITSLTSE